MCSFFLYLFFPYYSRSSHIILKMLFLNFQKKKHDQTLLISLINLSLSSNFWITLGLMKSNGCVVLLNILHYILSLMWKNFGNVFLGHQGKCVFHIFSRLHSIMMGDVLFDGGWPFRIFVHHFTIFIQFLCNI